MFQINTLVKPTHQCNMRCKYCFAEKYGYDKSIIDMSSLKKYIFLLSQKYNLINIVWHGGEPLTIPLDFYEEIYDYCKKIDAKFIYSLQTNGTLLNKENIEFFKRNKTNIGLSFDGLSNSKTRGNTKTIISNIKLLQKNEMFPGAVLVINDSNVNTLIEEYEYFKSLNLGMKINPMFNDGAAKHNSFLSLKPEQYVENFLKLYKHWAKDMNCNINVSTLIDVTNLIIHECTGVCTHNSCLGKWLCFDSNGHIYPCDRLCLNQYDLGDIKEIENIDEVFMNDNFINLLERNIERRENCSLNCHYFKNCYGGCNANAILYQHSRNNTPCYIQKNILKEIKKYLTMLEETHEYDNMNLYLRKMIENRRK